MAWYNKIFGGGTKDKGATIDQTKPIQSQVPKGGRRSHPDSGSGSYLGILTDEMATITPDFQLEMLDVLKHLALYNSDVSYAVDNVVQLCSTEYVINFDDTVKVSQREAMLADIKDIESELYAYGGGIRALRSDLFAQVILTGALSAEGVPNKNLDGIDRVVMVSPKNIRFKYDKKNSKYVPYQVIPSSSLLSRSSRHSPGDMIKLNTLTYKYVAVRRFDESPYAIPPLMAALESICTEKSMLKGLQNVVNKFGLLGFLKVLISKPVPLPNQSPEAYTSASKSLLDSAGQEVEKGLRDGFMVGFKDQHEFDMVHTTASAEGAAEIYQLNQESKMAGLKQDPLMLGRNTSVTDAVGRVLISKLSAQLQGYQLAVDTFLSEILHLHLVMRGYKLRYVQVESKKPLLMDEIKELEAYMKKIEINEALYQQGVISQLTRAQNLGFDKADTEKPRGVFKAPDKTVPNPISKKDLPSDTGPTKRKKQVKKKKLGLDKVA